MDNTLLEELDRLEKTDALTSDEMRELRRRAEADPDMWDIRTPIPPLYEGESLDAAKTESFSIVHKPTGKRYPFNKALGGSIWHKSIKQADVERNVKKGKG